MTCSQRSALVGEPLDGTATTAGFWMIVEQNGPYAGREAALSSGLRIGPALLAAVGERGGKLLLARRPGRHAQRDGASRRVWWSWAGYPRPIVWTATVDDPADLLPPWQDDPAVAPLNGAVLQEEPVLLVCTHGRRDACCATKGRAVLAEVPDGQVWESSHQGGHRFAPVLFELTTGYQHGRVEGADLAAVAAEAARGRIHLPTARGHVGLSPEAQAVDLAVRRHTGAVGLRDISLETSDRGLTALVDGQRLWAEITVTALPSRPESCGAAAGPASRFDVRLTALAASP